MNKTTKQVEAGTEYVLPEELKAAIASVHDAIERRKALVNVIDSSPAQLAAKEQEIASLRGELVEAEADILLIEEGKVPALQKQIDKMVATIEEKEVEVSRFKARIDALEQRVPTIDSEIEAAGPVLNIEVSKFSSLLKARIGAELRDAMPAVRAILNKARALESVGYCADFFRIAFVPDLELAVPPTLVHIGAGQNNLLNNDTPREPNVIDELLAPARAAMAAMRAHRPYVPLANRPKPYVTKGVTHDGRPVKPEPQPDPEPPRKTIDELLKEPYVSKGGSVRTWDRPFTAEMDIGRSMMAAADSANQQ
jgi:hypothetical protein